MLDNLIVILIVTVAIVLAGKRMYRTFSNDGAQCGCGSGDDCTGCKISQVSICTEDKNSVNSKKCLPL